MRVAGREPPLVDPLDPRGSLASRLDASMYRSPLNYSARISPDAPHFTKHSIIEAHGESERFDTIHYYTKRYTPKRVRSDDRQSVVIQVCGNRKTCAHIYYAPEFINITRVYITRRLSGGISYIFSRSVRKESLREIYGGGARVGPSVA